MHARQAKFPPGPSASGGSRIRRGRGGDEQPPLFGGLSWTQIRLHCAASIATALDGRRALRFMRPPDQQRVTVFTFAAEFIN